MQVCRCASVQVCKCASVQVCRCANVQVCRCAGVQVCRCASVQVRSVGASAIERCAANVNKGAPLRLCLRPPAAWRVGGQDELATMKQLLAGADIFVTNVRLPGLQRTPLPTDTRKTQHFLSARWGPARKGTARQDGLAQHLRQKARSKEHSVAACCLELGRQVERAVLWQTT